MYVTSKAGTEILKSQYEIIDSINGIPTLETDYSQLKHNHTEPMLMLSPAFNDKYIMVLKEQESVTESSRLRLTGVHSFIYDFSLDRIYEEFTQYFSLENILTLVFSDTEYDYEVSGSTRYNALEFENFGDNDKMSLINQICDRWELEYRVKGNKVYFADQRGTKTTKQFRYKMNIHDSHVNLDISEGATYIRAYFGKKDEENPSNSTYVEKEMLHPLAEDFGVRHAKPYSNEVITQEETMQRYMKMKIEETWKLSVEIDVLDLSGDGSAEVGDEVWAIDERMDLKYKTRIVEKRDYYDVNDRIYRTKVVLGNKTFIEAVSAQEVTADDVESQVVKYYNQMIEQLKADFDNDFNAERDAYKAMLEQAKADIFTEIAADKDRMKNILETMTEQWTEDFNQSVAEYEDLAERKAEEKASAVQSNLDSFKDFHRQLYDEVTGDILDIDTFLGDKSKTLAKQFAEMESGLNQSITAESGRIDAIVTNFGESGKSLAQFVLDVDSIEKTVVKNDDWLGTHGSNLLQTVEGFEQKVWMSDVANINPNLIPFADVANKDNLNYWTGYGNVTNKHINDAGQFNVNSAGTGTHIGIQSSEFELVQGRTYTFSVIVQTSEEWNTQNWFNYTYLMRNSGNNTHLGSATKSIPISNTVMLKQWTFTATRTEDVYILLATPRRDSSKSAGFGFREPKLEEGTERTLFMNAFSNIEQKANELSLKVAELSSADGEDFLTQSDITVQADRVRIGSVSIGSTDMASILSVSPSAIDMITDKLNLTGNLNVKGQIESLAVSAVRGDIAYLKTNILTANSITSEHLSVSTAMVHKLFAASARIDELITKSHFVNNVKAMSIEAVEGQFSSLMTKYLNANYIDVNYINGKNAWFESQYTLNANIAKLTAQHAFIRDVQAIEITANQLNLTTLTNRINQIEGGLKITRPDGAVWVRNGVYEFSLTMQRNQFMSPNVTWTGQNYTVPDETWRVFETIYAYHDARYITVAFLVSITNNSAHASAYIFVRVREFSSGNALGEFKVLAPKSGTAFQNIQLDLGIPTYSAKQFYLEARMSEDTIGSGVTRNHGLVRVNRAVMKG